MTPSLRLSLTMVRSSFSVMGAGSSSFRMPIARRTRPESPSTITITGLSACIRIQIVRASPRAISCARTDAAVFGVISPNTRTSRVITPVTMPTALLPKNRMASVVARDEAEIFTILFPTRIAPSIRAGSSRTFRSVCALRSPSSASMRMRTLFTVVSAVSADEK